MKAIGEFSIEDFGVEHVQYFQGIGVSCTPFTDCTYGIGDNPREAIADCLEQVARQGFETEDLESRICAELRIASLEDSKLDTPSVAADYPPDAEGEYYYHFGVLWTEESPNLDGLDPDDLFDYAADESNPLALRQYAAVKASAMELRAEGNIAEALLLESICEEKYSLLPQGLRW